MNLDIRFSLIMLTCIFLNGCDVDLFGYTLSLNEKPGIVKANDNRDEKLNRIYNVISIGDGEDLVVEAMGQPDSMSVGNGAFIDVNTYVWHAQGISYQINFVYGRVKDKTQVLQQPQLQP